MGNERGQLGRQRDHEGLFAFIEAPFVPLLDHQHTQHHPVVNDRDTEKRVERFLANLRQEAEARMLGGILHVDRLGALGYQSDKAFVDRQRKLADKGLVQPFIGRKQEAVTGAVDEVDRAHFGAKGRPHVNHQQVECLAKRTGMRDIVNDLTQGSEHVHVPVPRRWRMSCGINSRNARR